MQDGHVSRQRGQSNIDDCSSGTVLRLSPHVEGLKSYEVLSRDDATSECLGAHKIMDPESQDPLSKTREIISTSFPIRVCDTLQNL